MRNFKFYVLLFLAISSGNVLAFDADSILKELSFRTELEEHNFQQFLNDTSLFFPLFSSIEFAGTQGDIKSDEDKLLVSFAEFNTIKFRSYKRSKQAKLLFKGIHDTYFEKYELGASFHEIFSGGVYNCATATAVYGIVFEELDYPYEIKVMPSHVYLVLFPDEEAIKIETTNPLKGFVISDEKAKRDYVKFLRETKMISEKEYNSKSVNDLFDTYYYSHKSITLKQLIGVEYYNYGLKLFNESKWDESFDEFEKAKVFFNEERVSFMLMIALNNHLYSLESLEYEDLKYVIKLAKYSEVEASKQNVVVYFNKYLKENLLDKGDTKKMVEAYYYIESNLQDSSLKAEIDFNYHFEMGRHYYVKGKYAASNSFFNKAMMAKPNSIDAQAAFIESLIARMDRMDVDSSISLIQSYWNEYAFMHSNAQFSALVSSSYLVAALNAFNLSKISRGKECIDSFEIHYKSSESNVVNVDLVAEVYTTIAVYYFGKGQYTAAKKYINRGLEFAPNNYQLNRAMHSF